MKSILRRYIRSVLTERVESEYLLKNYVRILVLEGLNEQVEAKKKFEKALEEFALWIKKSLSNTNNQRSGQRNFDDVEPVKIDGQDVQILLRGVPTDYAPSKNDGEFVLKDRQYSKEIQLNLRRIDKVERILSSLKQEYAKYRFNTPIDESVEQTLEDACEHGNNDYNKKYMKELVKKITQPAAYHVDKVKKFKIGDSGASPGFFNKDNKPEEFKFYKWSEIGTKFQGLEDIPYKGDKRVGPGENRLAALLGGITQGKSSTFDILALGNGRWEVKQPGTDTTIRSGITGTRAFVDNQQRLNRVCEVVKSFGDAFMDFVTGSTRKVGGKEEEVELRLSSNLEQFLSSKTSKPKFDFEKGEITENVSDYKKFLSGEIRRSSFNRFASLLYDLKDYKDVLNKKTTSRSGGTKISLNDNSYSVEPETFIDVARIVKDDQRKKQGSPEKGEISVGEEELLLSILRGLNDVFKDIDGFADSFWGSLKASECFDVDGIFLVSSYGFQLIPSSALDGLLELDSVSQNRPTFKVKGWKPMTGVPKSG